MRSIFLVVAACSHPPAPATPAPPPPEAPEPPPIQLDDDTFRELLGREDWSGTLDARGFVVFDDSSTGRRVDTKCGPRSVHWAKYEALAFLGDLIARSVDETEPVEPHHLCHALGRYTFDCYAPGQRQHFRFVARGTRFQLVGLASYQTAIAPADARAYEAAIRRRQRCR